jgi:two-component system, cell cycle response regulator
MEHSILIVGHPAFGQMIQAQLQHLTSCSITLAASSMEAGLAMQASPPNLVIIQGDDLSLAQRCLNLKSRSHFDWFYSLLVVGFEQSPNSETASQLAHQTQALELGADAYLSIGGDFSQAPGLLGETYGPLLQAQLKIGLQSASRYQELVKTNDLLSTIALVDPLTELNNRRALDWDLPRQIKTARQGDRPFSLLIFDLDFFKRINDTYGHLVGDVSLKLLSARLRHNLRAKDTLFRYGGEEFVVLLSDTSHDEAGEIARRLCAMIGEQSFTINDDLELALTVSVGVSELQASDDPKGLSLLERADACLRKAKQTGRNRVVIC